MQCFAYWAKHGKQCFAYGAKHGNFALLELLS